MRVVVARRAHALLAGARPPWTARRRDFNNIDMNTGRRYREFEPLGLGRMSHERIDETPRHHDASRGASGADCFHDFTVFASAADAATDSNPAFEQRDDFGFELAALDCLL